jgi:hypothetical protein
MSKYYLYGISKNHIMVTLQTVFLCNLNFASLKFFFTQLYFILTQLGWILTQI